MPLRCTGGGVIADSIGEIRKGATWPPTPRNRLDSGEIPTEGAGNYGDIPIIRGAKGENSGVGMRSIGGIRVWLLGVRGVFGGSRSWILWVNVQFSCPVERISSRFCPRWESRIPTLSLHTNSSSSTSKQLLIAVIVAAPSSQAIHSIFLSSPRSSLVSSGLKIWRHEGGVATKAEGENLYWVQPPRRGDGRRGWRPQPAATCAVEMAKQDSQAARHTVMNDKRANPTRRRRGRKSASRRREAGATSSVFVFNRIGSDRSPYDSPVRSPYAVASRSLP
ncbi:hypothetical protein NL676_010536 [Syzygium grande]|nr:hypothetical protein NL676_010536 [Syzygium grande]